jgi:hypothetical protein
LEGTVIFKGLIFVAFGVAMTWLAVLNWRHRREERISLLEAAILKTTGVEPLPLTKFDRVLQWFQIVIMSLFGPLLTFAGLSMLFFGE